MNYVLDQRTRQVTDGPFADVRSAAHCVDGKDSPGDYYTSSRWMLARMNPRYPATTTGNEQITDDLKSTGGAKE